VVAAKEVSAFEVVEARLERIVGWFDQFVK